MVGAAAPQSQPQPPSAEEEALKRNTDCVYFLASPLTCKKGSECEYRHSDIARVNPRDCWFWLNGNCLNPKCGFRHPPLDGLLGTQMPTFTGSAQLTSQTVTTSSAHVVNATSKPGVPCKFFQIGFCLKGDWCPFLHTANSVKNKASLVPVTASAVEPSTFKKVENCVQEKKVSPTNKGKPIKGSLDPQVAGKVEPAVLENIFPINRRVSGTSCVNELPDYNRPPVSNGNLVSWSNRVHQPHLVDEHGMVDNKDAGDVSREPSPGFDVLVDDEGRDSDFYHDEDQYGMSSEYEARNEYDIDLLTDCNMIAEVDNDRYEDPRGYDSHRYSKGQYGLEQNTALSERMPAGSSYLKRPSAGADTHGQVDELDLRHRLARNKRPNGLRSVISHEHARDKHVEDRSYKGLRRHERHISTHETSLSSRLQGRIKLPERSSSPTDRSMIRGAAHGRSSPVSARLFSNQGRIQDRIKGRIEEASSDGWKNHRGLQLRRDMMGDNNVDFAGPKSLSELKKRKNTEPSGQHVMDQQQHGRRKYLVRADHQQNGNDLSFEGPKPLEEILKQKRVEAIGTVSNGNSSMSGNIIEDNNQKEGKSKPNNELVSSNKKSEVTMSASVEKAEGEESEAAACDAALRPGPSKPEAKIGTILGSGVDPESEVYEQREEFDSEQNGGENFDLYGGDNGDGEEEYLDDEEDDEFAKKMGVLYS